jgi:Na+-driven multidrug efflux pump
MTVGIAGVRPQIKDSLPVRTRAMLEGPILGTLLRLAAPNLLFIVSQAVVSIGETYFVGWLGSEALAAVSLVFPVLMVMQTMSGGGIGSGMASAISRALGGGRRDEANALVLVCLIIAVCFGGFFTLAVLFGEERCLQRWAALAKRSISPIPTRRCFSPERWCSGSSTPSAQFCAAPGSCCCLPWYH